MILIISQTEIDVPSDLVYNWLSHLGADCHRLNGVDFLEQKNSISITRSGSREGVKWNLNHFDADRVTAVWMRRWFQSDHFKKLDRKMSSSNLLELLKSNDGSVDLAPAEEGLNEMMLELKAEFLHQKRNEFKGFSQYFFELLRDKPTLGARFYSSEDPDKAKQMRVAQEVGLIIPDSIITNSKEELERFSLNYPKIICKNISEIAHLYYYKMFMTYTSVITPEFIEELPERFFLSLFQEAIEKEFEIRVFYLDKKLYSMAIFSAADQQTSIDFRVYNAEKPNRTVPFQLPIDIENKIISFMEAVNLTTGSLDLIYSTSGEYVFLEVNPVGQFGMVSAPCNYNLEKLVAEYLIRISKDGKPKGH